MDGQCSANSQKYCLSKTDLSDDASACETSPVDTVASPVEAIGSEDWGQIINFDFSDEIPRFSPEGLQKR